MNESAGSSVEKFQFALTEDGSPTLRLVSADGTSEAMHSLKGAFSETLYIYGSAIEHAFGHRFKPSFFSLGLGLGYVEVLTAALTLATEKSQGASLIGEVYGESFEADDQLREFFVNWIRHGGTGIPDAFATTYEQILERTARQFALPPEAIRAVLRQWESGGQWRFRGALAPDTAFTQRFSCLLYDAFSSKTSPELWSEVFLDKLFGAMTHRSCVLSTYACTGALKRSLRNAGFELRIREGFASKRDCTFAVRA